MQFQQRELGFGNLDLGILDVVVNWKLHFCPGVHVQIFGMSKLMKGGPHLGADPMRFCIHEWVINGDLCGDLHSVAEWKCSFLSDYPFPEQREMHISMATYISRPERVPL